MDECWFTKIIVLKSLGKGSLVLVVEFRYCNMHGPCLFLKSLQSCKLNSVGSIGSYCDRVVYFVTLLLPCGTFLSPSQRECGCDEGRRDICLFLGTVDGYIIPLFWLYNSYLMITDMNILLPWNKFIITCCYGRKFVLLLDKLFYYLRESWFRLRSLLLFVLYKLLRLCCSNLWALWFSVMDGDHTPHCGL